MKTIDKVLGRRSPPIVAILRGIQPREAVAKAGVLVEAGVAMIEVLLNSPEPFVSIAAIQAHFGDVALIGAGTVLDLASVERLVETGTRLMVTPNTDADVIAHGVKAGLEVVPGFLTPSEALLAVAAGARRLKLFPASIQGPTYIRAVREVLPPATAVWAVGSVDAHNAQAWLDAGAEGIALGTALYRPGNDPRDVAIAARLVIAALRAQSA